MTDAEILKKAIDKATDNGFVMDDHKHFCEIGRDTLTGEIKQLGAYQSIIFDHNFAKEFYGEKPTCSHCGWQKGDRFKCVVCDNGPDSVAWKFHLQHQVLEDNPIRYLAKFID